MNNYILYNDSKIIYDDSRVTFDGLFKKAIIRKRKVKVLFTYQVIGCKQFEFILTYKIIGVVKKYYAVKNKILGNKLIELEKYLLLEGCLRASSSSYYSLFGKKSIKFDISHSCIGCIAKKRIDYDFNYLLRANKKLELENDYLVTGDKRLIFEQDNYIQGKKIFNYNNRFITKGKREIISILSALELV